MSKPVDVGSVKVGQFIVIDGEACKVVECEHSKPGKHGSAKARIVAISVFTGNKKNVMAPVDAKIEVPMIEKKAGQVIALVGQTAQIMDLETYRTFDAIMPEEEEIKSKIAPGVEIEYWNILGKTKIMRVKA